MNDSSIGEVCFTCHFAYGSQAQGCYIEYTCTRTDYNGFLNISRISVDTSTASKCVTGIHTSNYNVTFYDMDYNDNIYMKEYAIKRTNESVTGLPPPSITILTSTVSLITEIILSSPSPTTLCTDCDNSKL